GEMNHVVIVNNLFLGADPRVPGYRPRLGIVVGSAGSDRVPRDVRVMGNTILSGARRADGYAGSLRMSSRYGGLPRSERPLLANNVIGLLEDRAHVCSETSVSLSNVVVRGRRCSRSDRVGPPHLD